MATQYDTVAFVYILLFLFKLELATYKYEF